MSERGRSRSPKRLTPSPHRNGDVAMSPRAPSAGGSASGSRVIVIDGLTKNVHPGHLREIFGFYGKVTGLDLPVFKVSGLNRGKAALEFDRPNQAEEAVRCMDGGILDGSVLKVQVSADPLPPPRQPSPVARRSPPPPRRGSFRSRSPSPRRGGGWRRSPPPHRRRSPSPYGRSPSPRRGGGFDRRPPPAYGPGARNNFGGRGGDSYGGGRGGNSYGGGRGGNSFSGGRGGGRDFRGRGGDVYRPRSRSRTRSPPYRRPPPRRSPDYVRGARSRSRSPRRSYSRSLSPRRSRSRSYSRSRSRSFSPRRTYSRSISPRRDRSASMRSRSRSRTRSRSPRSASPRR